MDFVASFGELLNQLFLTNELFNLKEDPGQQHNMAKENPGKLEELLQNFVAETKGYYQQQVDEVKLE